MRLERTYEMETPPEPAMSWEAYERIISEEWTELLDREPSPTEREVQTFLEHHPALLPGAFGLVGNQSGHYPSYAGVITQPPLPSYHHRVPDFMWLSQDSETDQPVLIEIEAPAKRWFTASGKQTANLSQALNQIAQWKSWFEVPYNVQAFKSFYGLDRDAWMRRSFRPSYLLIYGRRAEANARPELTAMRRHLSADDVTTMTFDRLHANPKGGSELVCLRPDGPASFRVVNVPPTIHWSPGFAVERALAHGWEQAIEANDRLGSLRRDFLIRRYSYWERWAKQEKRGIINTGDAE